MDAGDFIEKHWPELVRDIEFASETGRQRAASTEHRVPSPESFTPCIRCGKLTPRVESPPAFRFPGFAMLSCELCEECGRDTAEEEKQAILHYFSRGAILGARAQMEHDQKSLDGAKFTAREIAGEAERAQREAAVLKRAESLVVNAARAEILEALGRERTWRVAAIRWMVAALAIGAALIMALAR